MSRLLHRSKSTKELRTKWEAPDEEVPRLTQPHTPNKLIRRRAGTIVEPKQLSPSKSLADFKVSIYKETITPSPKLPGSTPQFPTTQGPYMDPFPPRTSSRVSLSSGTSAAGIGVAIGSPTRERHMYIAVRGDTSESAGHSVSTSIPSFYLPPEPFNLTGGTDWSGKQGNNQGDNQEIRGWRRFFGRTLFGSKKGTTTLAQTPHPPVVETPSQQKHTPLMLSSTVSNLKKEEINECKLAEKQAKTQSSSQLLNVDIPTVEMERYSIMFRALLPDESQPKSRLPQKSTIYDRRRSKDLLSGGAIKERPKLQLESLKRHATTGGRITPALPVLDSPNPFSVPPKVSEVPKRAVRLGRSNTTAALTRDARPGPGFVLAGSTPDTDTIPSAVFQERKDPFHPTKLTPRAARNSLSSQGSGKSISKSITGSFNEGDDEWLQEQKPRSTASDERSNIIKSQESPATKSLPSSLNSTPRRSSQDDQLSLKHSSSKQSIIRTEEELMIAAQQSIQRQITISQRQLLLPVVRQKPKPALVQPSSDNSGVN